MGNRIARWQAPSSGRRSTRTPGTQDRPRDGRRRIVIVGRQIAIVGARVHSETGGILRGAKIEIVGIGTAAPAGGRAEKGEETDVETTVAPGARGARVARGRMRLEEPEVSVRRGRNGNDRISKGCLEPQPWARRATGRPRVEIAGTLLGARPPAEQSRLQPVMVMRSPRVKVTSLPRGVALPVQ